MVIYEVTAKVRAPLRTEFERYMTDIHIPDVVATGCFVSASFLRAADRYRICYKLRDRSALDDYLASHAARLRAEFIEQFPEGIDISREVLDTIAEFPAADLNTPAI